MNSDEKEFFGCLGVILAAMIAVVMGAIVGGWVLSVLWGWFIIPVFHLPPLTIGQAIGISIVISFLVSSKQVSDKKKKKETWELVIEAFAISVGAPLLSLGIGWLVHLFV